MISFWMSSKPVNCCSHFGTNTHMITKYIGNDHFMSFILILLRDHIQLWALVHFALGQEFVPRGKATLHQTPSTTSMLISWFHLIRYYNLSIEFVIELWQRKMENKLHLDEVDPFFTYFVNGNRTHDVKAVSLPNVTTLWANSFSSHSGQWPAVSCLCQAAFMSSVHKTKSLNEWFDKFKGFA